MKNYNINEEEKKAIEEAIKNFEKQSSAEIMVIITEKSNEYLFIPVLWSAIIALLLPLFSMFFNAFNPEILYKAQILIFVFLTLIFQLEFIKMKLVPKTVKYRRAMDFARVQFFALGLHKNKNRASVMIFVSAAEHYVEILADSGICEKVDQSVWEEIVTSFIQKVKENKMGEGFLISINKCGELLTTYFPYDPSQKDDLPNHLIEI